jgi:hypothetical protein
MTPQTSSSHHASSPETPWSSTRALLTDGSVTWRQATEGWAVLTTLGVLLAAAGVSFKVARSLSRAQ